MGLDLQSVRLANGQVKISIPAEDLLRKLFGRRYTNIHGTSLSVERWRKIGNRLIDTLELCIAVNLATDEIHKKEINRYLRIARESLKTKKNTDPDIMLALLGLCFELLGGIPDNRKKLIVDKHPNHHYTGRYRSINFSTSISQKVNIIMKSAYFDEFKKYYSCKDLDNMYEGDAQSFLKAFKEKYPEAYAKIF